MQMLWLCEPHYKHGSIVCNVAYHKSFQVPLGILKLWFGSTLIHNQNLFVFNNEHIHNSRSYDPCSHRHIYAKVNTAALEEWGTIEVAAWLLWCHGSGWSFTFPPPDWLQGPDTELIDRGHLVFIWSRSVLVSAAAGLEIGPEPDLRQTHGAKLTLSMIS